MMMQQSDCLEKWRAELNAIEAQAEQLTAGLTDEQFNWHPASDKWSIAQILDHLNIVARLTLPRLEAATADAPRVGSEDPWSPSFLERLFFSMLGPNAKFKSPVPPAFVPGDGGSRQSIMDEFRNLHQRYVNCVNASEGVSLKRIRASSAANKMIKLSLGGWFESMVAHEQYHLGQAKSVRSDPTFPATFTPQEVSPARSS